MKRLLALPFVLFLASCQSSAPVATAAPKPLILDKAHSSLAAVALKNEVKEVTVNFPTLDGSLELNPFKGDLKIGVDTLSTGDPTRDANVKNYFFETALAAVNATADFTLASVDGDLSSLTVGQAVTMTGKGSLSLHGASIALQGPLSVTKMPGGGYTAVLGDKWIVNIPGASMATQLANLDKNCPQPHRVAADVTIKGQLSFIPQP